MSTLRVRNHTTEVSHTEIADVHDLDKDGNTTQRQNHDPLGRSITNHDPVPRKTTNHDSVNPRSDKEEKSPDKDTTNTPTSLTQQGSKEVYLDEDGFQVVKRRRRVKINIGTGHATKEDAEMGFAGANKKIWLYLNRVKMITTEDMIIKYLSEKKGLDVKDLWTDRIFPTLFLPRMKIPRIFVVIAATCLFVGEILAEQKLLVKHQKRRIRQDSLREYLPPSVTDKPRPFEPRPHGDGIDENGNFIDSGYPLPSTPQPPFHFATSPPVYSSTPAPDEYLSGSAGLSTLPPPSPPSGFQTQRPSSFPGYPTEGPYPYHPSAETTGYPSNPPIETERPSFSTVHPSYLPPQEPTGYPSVRPEGPSTSGEFPGFPTQRPPVPTQPPQEEVTPEHPAYPTAPPSEHPGYPSGHPTEHPGYPSGPPSEQPGYPTAPPQEFPGYPTASPPGVTPGYPTPPNPAFPSSPTTCYTGLSHRTPAKRYRLPDRISPGRNRLPHSISTGRNRLPQRDSRFSNWLPIAVCGSEHR
ncbi:hypothetical protein JTB14_023816 [Gonioctena quinquepunctata]|nr:hypothetical protein JTB14_023816 [Gonioctena quinquepunctata]